jgi:hypothetical protein
MSNIIRIKRGITGGVVPTGLTFGELAVNITDKKLFVGGITGNTIELLASNGGGGGGTAAAAGQTGNIQFKYGSGLSASSGFSLSPVDPTYEPSFTPIPSQPSYTDTLKLISPTAQSGTIYEVSPIGLAFHRHLRGEFDDTGGSVIEAVGSIYGDFGDGAKARGNNLILRSSGEGETGYKGHIRIFDAYNNLAQEISNDDQGSLYNKMFGQIALNGVVTTSNGISAGNFGNAVDPITLKSSYVSLGDVDGEGDNVRFVVDNSAVAIEAHGSFLQYGGFGIQSDNTVIAPVIQAFDPQNGAANAYFSFPNGQTAQSIVTKFNGLSGNVSLTAGSNITLTQNGNLIRIAASAVAAATAPPLASATLTGAASFNPIYFSISPTGHVGLASAYQVTGDTVVTNSGLSSVRSGNTVTITNIGVTAFNGLTGSVSMTGDGGAVYGIGNNTIAARVATTSVTGAASFNPVYFTTGTTGHVSLAAGYQVTGDTVSAGTGIGTVRSGNQVTVSNAGVLTFNGLSGAASMTGDGGAIRGVGNNTIVARLASLSVTGSASFSADDFVVGTTGHVGLTATVARTNATNNFTAVQSFPNGISGAWLSIGAGSTFSGNARFNGGILVSNISTGITGISIARSNWQTDNLDHNTIKTTDGLYIIQSSGNTANSLSLANNRVYIGASQGLYVSPLPESDTASLTPTLPVKARVVLQTTDVSTATYNGIITSSILSGDRTWTFPDVTGTVAIVTPSGPGSNIVRSINGATSGDLSITGDGSALFGYNNGNNLYIGARNASASLTGVASFSTNDFVVGTTGHVGLTATVARTNATNNFTAVQSFPNGISGAWLSIGAGATFNGRATFAQGLSSSSLWVGGGATFTGAVSISGGTAWHANNDGKGSGLDTDLVRGVNADRLLEEIQTGLLYGGVITINAGNTAAVDVSAGAGIIVTVNGSTGAFPAPDLQTVTWTAKTGITLAGMTSSDFTFFRIDSSGNLQQSSSNFSQTQYLNSVVIGNAVHQSRAYVNRVHYHPLVAYASSAQYETFIRYFGGLKVDGYVISGLGTTGQIQHTTGTAFALGANMDVDPNNPSLVTDSSAVPVQQLFYLYRNADGTYRTDPVSRSTVNFANYDNGSGTLGNISNNNWSIQRVYKIPGLNNALYIYYGTASYSTDTVAANNILLETFAEADITRYNGVFLGWLIVRGGGSNASSTNDCRIVPGGFFRNTTGGGGASTVLNLDDLGDVAVTTPANNQILRYDSTQGLWVNSPLSSVSTLASTSLTGVASFSSNDFVVGTTGHVGLTGTIARTNSTNNFTAVQSFPNGISGNWLSVSGATFAGKASFNAGLSGTLDASTINVMRGVVSSPVLTLASSTGPATYLTNSSSVNQYNTFYVTTTSSLGAGTPDVPWLKLTNGDSDFLTTSSAELYASGQVLLRAGNGVEVTGTSPNLTVDGTLTNVGVANFRNKVGINAGLSAHSLYTVQGATFNSNVTIVGSLTSSSLWVGGGGATFASNASFSTTTNHAGLATFTGGITSSSLWVGGGATFASAVQFIGNISAPNIVNSVNGLTAAVSITSGSNVTLTQTGNLITIAAAAGSASAPPLASASITGVASFGINDFVVSVTGSVSLTGTVARTNAAQTFTGLQTFANGLSAAAITGSSLLMSGNVQANGSLVSGSSSINRTTIAQGTITTNQVNTPSIAAQTAGNGISISDSTLGSAGIVINTPTTVILGDYGGLNTTQYLTVNAGQSQVDFGLMDIVSLGAVYFTNNEYIFNGTNGRLDFMPSPNASTAFGLYADMTSWGYGVVLGTIRSSDGAVNTGGNIRFDVPLTINNDTHLQMGNDGQYSLYRTTTGNDTMQIRAYCDGVNNSGAWALVGYGDVGNANRSPTTKHANPNFYIYRNGTGLSGDFMRMEHDGAVGRIASGATTGISIEPGNKILGISGGASAGNLWVGGAGATFASNASFSSTTNYSGLATFTGGLTSSSLWVGGGATFTSAVQFISNISAPNIVNSVNGLTAAVSITSGSNITLTQSANLITIASTASGGFTRKIVTFTGATSAGSASSTDYVYIGATSDNINLTMPTAVSNTNRYTVKQTNTGTLTIITTSSQTIDGVTGFALNRQYQAVDLISDNSNWIVV